MKINRSTGFALILIAIFSIFSSAAQNTAAPAKAASAGDDVSGMYSFLRDGEFVQITIDRKEGDASAKSVPVSGFVSRYGDLESDRGVFLDHFFTKGSLENSNLTFTTRMVHGTWFEFTGQVERGDAKSRATDGYYVLKGTLKQNVMGSDKKVTAKSREITMKSFPDLDDSQAQK
jgi:hypothetical protein